jgi:HK97 family phage prohead protease
MEIKTREMYFRTDFQTRQENDAKYIEGYFIRFNEETELWDGVFEEVAPEAVEDSLKNNDIRCLFNHDTSIVLGRTGNGTLELKKDSIGIFGRVKINPNDKQALDVYARIERGDINACSFGFNIINEEIQNRDDGTVKFILREIDLKEVSPVTFPAYPTTSISARKKDYEQYKQKQLELRKNKLKERLEGCLSNS